MTQIRPAEETQSWCERQDGRQPLGENKTGRSGAGIGAGAGRGGAGESLPPVILKAISQIFCYFETDVL